MMALPPFVINKKNNKCPKNPAAEQSRGILSWGPCRWSGPAPCQPLVTTQALPSGEQSSVSHGASHRASRARN